MALDSFFVRDASGGAFDSAAKLARLAACIEKTLAGQLDPMAELVRRKSPFPSRYQVFKVAPRVLIDNRASSRYTVIEVNGRDRPGLLYQVTQALTRLKLMIHSAKISTYGERAVDVFYVEDVRGGKVTSEPKQKRIRSGVLKALEAVDGQTDEAKPRKTRRAQRPLAAGPGVAKATSETSASAARADKRRSTSKSKAGA